MTTDDIIRMAREAGMERVIDVHKDGTRTIELPHPDSLKRFAALATAEKNKEIERLREARTSTIALCEQINAENNLLRGKNQQLREALDNLIAAEREACAKLCERLPAQQDIDVRDQCAAAIRARGKNANRKTNPEIRWFEDNEYNTE